MDWKTLGVGVVVGVLILLVMNRATASGDAGSDGANGTGDGINQDLDPRGLLAYPDQRVLNRASAIIKTRKAAGDVKPWTAPVDS